MPATIYAIGDIHGCPDPLDTLLARIETHRAGRDARIVFLGDYVDRGPDSRGVLERVAGTGAIALLGNHEDMMLGALEGDARRTRLWLVNGGEATMRSYGCEDIEAFRATFPPHHLAFLRSLSLHHETADLYFAHAGIDPARPLAEQRRHDLLWIRDAFLDHAGPLPKRVVHGHTPNPHGPDILPFRVNVDTGCVKGGPLTAVAFEGREVADVLQVFA